MRLLLWLALMASPAFALTTAYVSFDHPDGWRCELSQGVWICQSTIEPDRKESVVLSIATMATEWDTLDNYEQYLKQPRPIQDEDGRTLTSTVTYTRRRNINGTVWIDSLQYNSELPGFWARYVATVHNKLAILITYIVSKDSYQKLAPQFERMVNSLKPNAEFDLNVASKQGDGPIPGSQKYGQIEKDILLKRLDVKKARESMKKAEAPVAAPAPSSGVGNRLLLLVGAGALIALILLRSRRKKKQGPKAPGGTKPETRKEPAPPTRRIG